MGFWPGTVAQGMRVAICLLSFRPPWWQMSLPSSRTDLVQPQLSRMLTYRLLRFQMSVPLQEPRNHDPQGETTSQVVSVRRLCMYLDEKFCYQKVWEMLYIFPFGP